MLSAAVKLARRAQAERNTIFCNPSQIKPSSQQRIAIFIFQLLKTAVQRNVTQCTPGKGGLGSVGALSLDASQSWADIKENPTADNTTASEGQSFSFISAQD
jgi:hypothetical protein